MRKITATVLVSLMMAAAPALAGMNNHGGCPHEQGNMGNHGSMNHTAHGQNMDSMEDGGGQHDARMGEAIRQTNIKGHRLEYRLIDMQKQMADMENMPQMAATHHLMVYLKRPDGSRVDNAMVGYLVNGTDGNSQKTMAMGMGGGYGADLDLSGSKRYTVKVKALVDDQTLIDTFTYPAEQ